jgi:hypothetical protein
MYALSKGAERVLRAVCFYGPEKQRTYD